MATATQDDLLIIQDETEASGDDFSFNFDFDESLKEGKNTDSEINEGGDKGASSSTKEEGSATIDEVSISENSDTLGNLSGEITKDENTDDASNTVMITEDNDDTNAGEGIIIEENSDNTTEDTFSIDLGSNELSDNSSTNLEPEVGNDTSGEVSSISVFEEEDKNPTVDEDLNSILTGTIAKLQSRKKTIEDDTVAKKKKASELSGEIESLESQVSQIESVIASLGQESEKIDTNISQLESMKLDPVKEHNSRRTNKK